MKNLITKILLIILPIVLVLFLFEAIFRIFQLCPNRRCYFTNPQIIFSANPKLVYEFNPSSPDINSDGMHDREYTIAKPSDTMRIAILGDSIAYGIGVYRDQTFAKVLEDKLNKWSIANQSNMKYEVLNFAVQGYNTNNEIEQLKVKAAKYKPDIIILSYCINDNSRMPHLLPLFFNIPNLGKTPCSYFNFFWSFRLTRFLATQSDFFRFILQRIYLMSFLIDNKEPSYQTVIDGFKELRKYADSHSAQIIILFNPQLDYEENDSSDNEMVVIKNIAYDNHLIFINMLDYYRHNFKHQEDLWIRNARHPVTGKQDVCHTNALGHKAIANELFREIITKPR